VSKRKPVVGEILYSLNVGNSARRTEQKLTPVEVVSVGRKYFTVSEQKYKKSPHMHPTFHISNWYQKADYTADAALYESPQEWEDEKESQSISSFIAQSFRYGNTTLPLSALRQIKQIIDQSV